MHKALFIFSHVKYVLLLGIGVLVLSACGTRSATVQAPTLVVFPGTPTPQCLQEEVLPTIDEVQPDEIRPGTEVAVSARGGYFRYTCGGVNESARTYKIYFDDEPVGDLMCYVNHCEGKFLLSANVAAGRHCIGVQKGSCQMEVDVIGD